MINDTLINEILNSYFSAHNFNVRAEMGTDFCYWYNARIVDYTLVVSEKMDNLFLDFALKNGLKVDCGIFILSLFHEIGHSFTYNDFINDIDENKDNLDPEEYFNLPEEKIATLWAIGYINNHAEELKQLSEDLQPVILETIKDYL